MKAITTLVTAAATAAVIVTPALASASSAAGGYTSWSKAQHAAGFKLKRPGTALGLKLDGKIEVDRCFKAKTHGVTANYGKFLKKSVGIAESNAGEPCFGNVSGTALGKYHIDGVTARMRGDCGAFNPAYSCKSRKIGLTLSWKKGKDYYIASSFNETRRNLAKFAKKLKKV